MWHQGIRIVNIDEALAREREELQESIAAATRELASVTKKRQCMERGRREALRDLKDAQQQRAKVEVVGCQRAGARARGEGGEEAAQASAHMREQVLHEELKLLRR